MRKNYLNSENDRFQSDFNEYFFRRNLNKVSINGQSYSKSTTIIIDEILIKKYGYVTALEIKFVNKHRVSEIIRYEV